MPPPTLLRLTPLRPTLNHLLPRPNALNKPHHPTPTTPLLLLRRPPQSRTLMTSLLLTTSSTLTTLSNLLPAPTPWYLLIPLSAVLLRTLTTLPLTLYSRSITRKTIALQPLLSAWTRTVQRTSAEDGSAVGVGMKEWEEGVKKVVEKRRKEVVKRWGVERWRVWMGVLGQMPVWVVATFTLRGMATERVSEDLVASATSSTTPQPPPKTATATAGITDGATSPAIVDVSATTTGGSGGNIFSLISETTQSWIDAIPVEQSLSQGGALWFENLLEPDKYYVLPLGLSLVIFANIEFSALQFPATSRLTRILRNALRIFPLAVIPITMQTPTALTLYWISSAMYSLVQNLVLQFWFPLPKVPGAGGGKEAEEKDKMKVLGKEKGGM